MTTTAPVLEYQLRMSRLLPYTQILDEINSAGLEIRNVVDTQNDKSKVWHFEKPCTED